MIKDFYKAWYYLSEHGYYKHPKHGYAMSAFPASLYIMVVKVNPENLTIEDDESLNTLTQVWIESGCWVYCEDSGKYEMSHDYKLDTGGDSFEEAIVNLANILEGWYD